MAKKTAILKMCTLGVRVRVAVCLLKILVLFRKPPDTHEHVVHAWKGVYGRGSCEGHAPYGDPCVKL